MKKIDTAATEDGDRVSLQDCPRGLFLAPDGTLLLKSEFQDEDGSGQIDAFVVSDGAYWVSGVAPERQPDLLVRPIAVHILSDDPARWLAVLTWSSAKVVAQDIASVSAPDLGPDVPLAPGVPMPRLGGWSRGAGAADEHEAEAEAEALGAARGMVHLPLDTMSDAQIGALMRSVLNVADRPVSVVRVDPISPPRGMAH